MYIKNGVRATLIKSDKFKTNIVGVFFSTELDKENVTKNALVPAVLRRGTKNLPTMRDISIELEKLYGAKFDCGVSKKGELQVLRFYGEAVNDKYLPDSDNNTLKLAEMIKDIIFNPAMVNGKFNEEYLAQEKNEEIVKQCSRILLLANENSREASLARKKRVEAQGRLDGKNISYESLLKQT